MFTNNWLPKYRSFHHNLLTRFWSALTLEYYTCSFFSSCISFSIFCSYDTVLNGFVMKQMFWPSPLSCIYLTLPKRNNLSKYSLLEKMVVLCDRNMNISCFLKFVSPLQTIQWLIILVVMPSWLLLYSTLLPYFNAKLIAESQILWLFQILR